LKKAVSRGGTESIPGFYIAFVRPTFFSLQLLAPLRSYLDAAIGIAVHFYKK
jgi:hypothetical protein